MRATRERSRAILMAPLGPARILPAALSEWYRAATRGEPLSMTSNSLFLIVAKVGSLAIGFLCWLVAARLFPASNVGVASATVSATTLVALFAVLGIGWSVIGQFPSQERPGELLDTAISLVGIGSLVTCAAFLLVAALFLDDLRVIAVDPRFAVAFVLFAVTGTLGLILDQISTVMRRGDQAMTRNVVKGLVTLAIVPAALLATEADRSLAIVAAWSVGSVGMIIVGVWQFARGPMTYRFRPRIRLALARPLIELGIPNYILNIAERLPGSVLPIIVTEMISPADSAYWYGAWMMAWVVFFIPIQIGTTLYAEISNIRADVVRLARQALRLSLGLGGLTAVVAVAGATLALSILGPAYADAGETPLRIVVLAVVPMSVFETYYTICRVTGHLNEAVAVSVLNAIASLAAAVAVAQQHGLVGIATAWLAVQAVTGVWAGLRLVLLLRSQPRSGELVQPVALAE